jgi:uncharacterized repeat protein (TIGR01451 family)
VRAAALAAALVPLASVAATPASAQAFCESAGICGVVFSDTNNNGIQDAGELGIEGIVVTIDGGATTLTNEFGVYFFGVPPGTYQIAVDTPPGTQPSTANVGIDDTRDSDGVDDGNDHSVAIVTLVDEQDTTTDFGFAIPMPAESATGTANCSGFSIHIAGAALVAASYQLAYSITLTPSAGTEITVHDSIPVTVDASGNFDVGLTRTWADFGVTLGGMYAVSGDVSLFTNAGVLVNETAVMFPAEPLSCSPPPSAHLTISKSPKNGTFQQGEQVTFTLVVVNDGGSNATNVHVSDQLPGNGGLQWTQYTASQGSCTLFASNLLDCNLGTIPPAGSVTLTVASPSTTPMAACQAQLNPEALAIADGGLRATDSGSFSCTPPPLPCPGGSFTFHLDTSGNLIIVFDQFPAPNDNSYGVNAVGWGSRTHKFSDLVGSDHAGFQLVDPSNVVKLSFNIDYLSVSAGAPSGYASLGPFGGDGKVLVGSLAPSDILWATSIANNLNNINIPGLFDASHVQQFGSVNVLVDSPPTDPLHQTYSNSDLLLAGWNFHDTYYVMISAAKLASLGFDANWRVEPNLDALHNSPAKACPAPSEGTLTVTKTEVKDRQVKVTLFNSGSLDEVINGIQLSWPAANGKLKQVKLNADVLYDKPDIAPPTANLTLLQLVADQKKRTIQHGKSEVLTLVFEKNANNTLAQYTGTISTSGFTLTILP